MDALTNDRDELTLNELTKIKAFSFTNGDQRLVYVGVELGSDVFALQTHYGNSQREYVEKRGRKTPCVITETGPSGSVTKKLPVDVGAQLFTSDLPLALPFDRDRERFGT